MDRRQHSITDGDTLTILDETKVEHKIRLAGIDAPEKKQPFGMASKQHLADAAFLKRAIVEGDKVDRYGRCVGKIWVAGKDINLEQVLTGLAWHYKKYEIEQPPDDRLTYAAAERSAREAKQGLWSDPNPIPPWAIRHPDQNPEFAQAKAAGCGGKKLCREMKDCAEAMFYFNECGVQNLDRNGDSEPCESLCGSKR